MRKSILFLTQVLPWPLDAGPKTRAYYVLRALAAEHDVTLLSFVRATDTAEAIAHLQGVCKAVHTVPIHRSRARDAGFLAQSLALGNPFVIQRDRVPAMEQAIARLLEEGARSGQPFGAVHADQLWMAPYALIAKATARKMGAPVPRLILDQHNATYRIFARLAEDEINPLKRTLLAREARVLATYELETTRKFDTVVWVTQEDVDEMAKAAAPGEAVPSAAVIPICIDAFAEPVIPPADPVRRVTFVGGLHYPPNAQGIVWFAREAFPRILASQPDALLTVIGKDPPAALNELGIPAANLDIPGYVVDPKPRLAQTAAFIVPIRAGGGMRVKIIDGWRWGLPVVSTTVGAEGIDYRAGEHLLRADTPVSLADAVLSLLSDDEKRRVLAAAGRAWVERQYDWRTVYRRWVDLYAG